MAYSRTTTTRSTGRRRRRRYRRPSAAFRRRWRRVPMYRGMRGQRYVPRRPQGIKISKYALGQIDPFDDRVYGAKVPDANTTPSATTVVNDEVVLTTDAVFQLAAKAFRPWVTSQTVQATAASANSWTWPAAFGGTNSSRLSTITSNFNLIRPVAHGIRLSCPLAPTAVTGFCHVALYAGRDSNSVSTWDLPTTLSGLNQCIWYKRYPLAMLTQKSLTVVNKVTDCGATVYIDPASDRAAGASALLDMAFQNEGFTTIVVAIEAAGISSTALAVESITHYECLPSFSGVITPSPAADFNPAELSRVSRISSVTDATMMDGEQDRRMNVAVNAILEGANAAMGQVAGAIGTGLQNAAYRVGEAAVHSAAGYASRYFAGGIPGVTNPRLLQY